MISYDPVWETLDKKGLNKEDLKKISGISGNVIAQMNKNQYISLSSIEKIGISLGATPDQIFKIIDDRQEIKEIIQPFIKWAGGKRQLLTRLIERMPKEFNTYYEPFVGGGALLFEVQPTKAVINDINSNLIHTYKTIKENHKELISLLRKWDESDCDKECYYTYRERFNSKIRSNTFDVETAALMIFINKRCFNGLYRVNSKGLFNVPFNGKVKANSINEENINGISKFLQNVTILNVDFEEVLNDAKKGDFIFFDSPYVPLKEDTFEAYTKEGFSQEDHIRLAKLFKKLDKKGCKIMLTNHDTKLVRDLYKDFNLELVEVKRMINSDASNRKGTELIITNYDTFDM